MTTSVLYTLTTVGVSNNVNSGALATFFCSSLEHRGLECDGLENTQDADALGEPHKLFPRGGE